MPRLRSRMLRQLRGTCRAIASINFLKWGYNRNWSEPGWPAVAPEDQNKQYVAYVQSHILLRWRRSCDLSIIHYTDEVWPSDDRDPFDRSSIQGGFRYAYPPGLTTAWVTDFPNWVNNRSTSLEYRFFSAMQGGLAIGANLNKWTPEDFQIAEKMVATQTDPRDCARWNALPIDLAARRKRILCH